VFIENKFTRRGLLSAIALAPAARLLSGQQNPAPQTAPPPQDQKPDPSGEQKPKFSTDVKLVNVFATVRDKSSGKIIKDLTQDNFSVDEEGRAQTIKFFEAESSLPLNLGLLVDTSYSQARVLGDERSAGIKFFDQVLRDKDQAFVIHFDHEIELLQDFTGSRDKLDKALNLLEPAQPQQQQQQTQQQGGGGYPQGGGGYPQGGGYPSGGGGRRYPQTNRSHGGTKLYDAILLASEDLMSKQQGRKALVLLTDGVDSGSKITLFESIRAAQKADTLVYPVLFADNDAYSSPGYGSRGMGRRMPMPPPSDSPDRPDGKKILQQIAEETGGRFNSVGAMHHLDKIFADIQEELRSQYNIGYTADPPPSEAGLYRHIHLTAKTNKKKDLVVQARAGYYSR
jgi:VWFA-related protein